LKDLARSVVALARWLLQTRDRIDSDVLPLTQEFLSQMLGVRRTTVTLVARQLEQAGVIQNRRAGPHRVFIQRRPIRIRGIRLAKEPVIP
jgi:Crp-like helix-turn-helix domain